MNSFFILVFDSESERQQTFSLVSDNNYYYGKVASFGKVESHIFFMFVAGKFYS